MANIDILTIRERIKGMDDDNIASAVQSIQEKIEKVLDGDGLRWIYRTQEQIGHHKDGIRFLGGNPYDFCIGTKNRINLFVYSLFAERMGLEPNLAANYK